MSAIRRVAVIDIGKTNAKVALVDLRTLSETSVRKTPNRVVTGAPYPHFDVEGIWTFIMDGLAALVRDGDVDAVSVTAHGATAALLDANGRLALPVLDYEHDGPDRFAAEYERFRPSFAETGTPRLPGGLNLGAQLFWQMRAFPEGWATVAAILTYPQLWTFRLTGVAATEPTSLGCHTDLWNPAKRDFSSLVDDLGWRRLFAPVHVAGDRLGTVTPAVAAQTGLGPGTPVFCGIHDSNASLLPHVLGREPPFAVVSTGTWVVSMSVGGRRVDLDPARDTLVNVNALGDPVPSARFMGGRDYEIVTQGLAEGWSEADVAAVLDRRLLLLPSIQGGSGPFPGRQSTWLPAEPAGAGARRVAAGFHLALMTATCLDLIGAAGPIVVEGPLAANDLFARMLRATTGRPVIVDAGAGTGTSAGAALLAAGRASLPPLRNDGVRDPGPLWSDYARAWRTAVAQ